MKIAVDLTSLADNFSGIERYAANITLSLIRNNVGNDFILVFKGAVHPLFESFYKNEAVDFCVLKSANKLLFSQIVLPKTLQRLKADCYLFLAFPSPLLFSGPSVSAIHDLCCVDCPETMTVRSRLLWRVLDWKAAKTGKAILTVSQFSKARIVEYYSVDPESVYIAHCGVDRTLFFEHNLSGFGAVKTKYRLPDQYIVSLSTIEPRKNLSLLISAWARLLDSRSIDVDLVLAGRSGWKSEALFEGLSEEHRKRLHVTGFVDDEDLPLLYEGSSLFVFPSKYEGFGLPPVEAMLSGAKVLCSKIPPLVEVFGEGVRYFIEGDLSSLERGMVEALGEDRDNVSGLNISCDWDTESRAVEAMITALFKDERPK